ncbi:uncharacterized protein M6B38_143630 [Iris pallida]|uniref:Uncharacterized protein n=1 Tax=Iris pallida TaxID=29817 RepID=A0AAX6FAQ4_IRIPA|nr:uncharacterized protein M6B38_143630 [Iris pallida]
MGFGFHLVALVDTTFRVRLGLDFWVVILGLVLVYTYFYPSWWAYACCCVSL